MEPIDRRREALRAAAPDAPAAWRIFSFGRYTFGPTDVVACLVRALRNLGHHVTHFDTEAFPDLVDDTDHSMPRGSRGGNGPLWVNVRALAEPIRRERPQIVLLLAGGLMLRPEDARWLRDQGIVLVGMTLSDPDVMPTIAPHAATFDLHTTNALACVEAYARHGAANTVWFPFGIDLSFAAAEVRADPALAADVICLGHARGREERNTTMEAIVARVGDRWRVRAYGDGWRLPGSAPVSGTRLIQASRGGRVHLNFPGTRAGYTNVKCGVFESIANGGLLLTQRFAEIERFFVPGREIACYERLEDAPEVVEQLLADRDAFESIARAGFERLLAEHTYERRWNALFAALTDAACHGGLGLGEARRAAVREALESGRRPPARPVLVSGWYGANNLGDEAILRSIVANLERRRPATQCVVVAAQSRRVLRRHGLEAIDRPKLNRCDDALRAADALVLGGGGLWHDLSFDAAGGLRALFTNGAVSIGGYANLGLLAYLRGVPFHTLGLGVGPLADPDARRLVGYVMRHVETATVRDEASEALLRAAAPGHPAIRRGTDCVYALPLPAPQPRADGERRVVVGLNLRQWGDAARGAALAAAVAEGIGRFAARRPGEVAVLTLPMQEGKTFDRAAIRRVLDRLDRSIPVLQAPSQGNFDAAVAAFGRPDVVLAMRLHACLLAHRYRVPAVGLAYDPKVRQHFEEVGRAGDAASIETGADWIAARLELACAQGLDAGSRAAIHALEARAAAMFDDFVAALPGTGRPRRLHLMASTAARNDDVENRVVYATRAALASALPRSESSASIE